MKRTDKKVNCHLKAHSEKSKDLVCSRHINLSSWRRKTEKIKDQSQNLIVRAVKLQGMLNLKATEMCCTEVKNLD